MPAPRANTPALPPILLVGRGRMGGAIARGAASAGLALTAAGRSEISDRVPGATAALLCVPDGSIGEACEALVAATPEISFVGHTSGATGLDALAAAEAVGASTFSLHPLQTVPDGMTNLVGSPAAVAGSDGAGLELARGLADALGMSPFEIPAGSRAAYHAAASIASNFLVTLESSAVALLAAAGVENGRELLAPIVLQAAANWAERGPEALTGPLARGDEATVERHQEAIARIAPELAPLYATLAERTRALAGIESEPRGVPA